MSFTPLITDSNNPHYQLGMVNFENLGMGGTAFVTGSDDPNIALKGHTVYINGCKNVGTGEEKPLATKEAAIAREARIYEHLGSHPSITKYYGVVEVGPATHAIRLERALGNVRQYICPKTKLNVPPPPLEVRLSMAISIASGLAHMHSKGVTHEDFSTRNILVFEDWQVKLADFGESLIRGPDTPLESGCCEDPEYALPNRGRNYFERPSNKREIFALACGIYEIINWERLFPALDSWDKGDEWDLEHAPDTTHLLAGEVMRDCWDEKYETADEVLAALLKVQEDLLASKSLPRMAIGLCQRSFWSVWNYLPLLG